MNPYSNRTLPVGQLDYPLSTVRAAKIANLKKKCMLEFGEQEVIFDMPRIVGLGGMYANLGHAMGGSAFLLARGIQDQNLSADVISVDTFDYFKGHWEKANDELKFQDLGHMLFLFKGTTQEYFDSFHYLPLSFVFIDADHSYEGVRKDFLNFGDMVVKGGVVAFHDTNQEPSYKVIQESIVGNPKWQQILHVNRIKAFRRV